MSLQAEQVKDLNIESLLFRTKDQSQTLIVAFANLMPDNSLAPFCYLESLKKYPVNQLFIRDTHKFMYLRGIDQALDSVHKLSEFLCQQMVQFGNQKTIFLGNSSGGYAAVLYGILTRPDVVLAFAPRTYLDKKNRKKHLDFRNPHIVDTVAQASRSYGFQRYLDLKKLDKHVRNHKTGFHLFWDRLYRIDDINASRMQSRNYFHHPYDQGGHLIAKHLRDMGVFDAYLQKILGPDNSSQGNTPKGV